MTLPEHLPSQPILTATQMREADLRAVESHRVPPSVLMENAARNAWTEIRKRIDRRSARIAVLCGSGNNGGDGIALARHALIDGFTVTVWLSSELLSGDAAVQREALSSFAPDSITQDLASITTGRWDVVVDAMLGTGAHGELREPLATAARWMNGESKALRCALDIPTGLDADTGHASPDAVCADFTVTMAALKPGLLLRDGPDLAGDVIVVPIGAPNALYIHSKLSLLDRSLAHSLLPPLVRARQKYDRGLVGVIGGAPGMRGALILSARAALHAGAGVVRALAVDAEENSLPWPSIPAELMLGAAEDEELLGATMERAAAIVLGPGIGRGKPSAQLVQKVLADAAVPVVLDADGLFVFAGKPELLSERNANCNLVITPHHGEAARLLGSSAEEIGGDPLGAACSLAVRSNTICVLKGASTVVALPDGRCWIASAGNPGMATAGSGDVLAGIIAACAAQRRDAIGGTLLGVHLHGCAGDCATNVRGVNGVTASDIIDGIAPARRELEEDVA